ncbi:MAG: class C sortase [Clostridia bacterium]|nr:class C sortase [Clostridia bacterium]
MRKIKSSTIIIIMIFLAGLSLLLYPFISNQWNNYRQKQLISSYESVVSEKESAGEIDYEAEWARAIAYNAALLPSILPDSFAIAEASDGADSEYMSCLNITDDGMMGTVEIPKIDVDLPIYHTTDEKVLENAAGHLEGSSLPIGGENSHAVISAHRGLPSATLFTDLDRLEEGDHFLLHILDDTLAYEVDMITVVEPEGTDALAVEEGQDFVTLLTCTPYGVNSHRLLVRGHRVPYEEEVIKEETPLGASLHTNYLLWVIVGLVITGGFILVLYIHDRKRREALLKKAANDVKKESDEVTGEVISEEEISGEAAKKEKTGSEEEKE